MSQNRNPELRNILKGYNLGCYCTSKGANRPLLLYRFQLQKSISSCMLPKIHVTCMMWELCNTLQCTKKIVKVEVKLFLYMP